MKFKYKILNYYRANRAFVQAELLCLTSFMLGYLGLSTLGLPRIDYREVLDLYDLLHYYAYSLIMLTSMLFSAYFLGYKKGSEKQ
ncbi:MAG: hypothetical protein ACTSR2_03040 [Candidatus Hodarchaeales archaeon]